MATKKTSLLRQKRKDLGLTLQKAAGKMGITISQLSRIERGHFERMPVDLAIRLRDFYAIPIEYWATSNRKAA